MRLRIAALAALLTSTACVSSVRTVVPEAKGPWQYTQEWNCPASGTTEFVRLTNKSILDHASRQGWRLVSAGTNGSDGRCWVFTFETPVQAAAK